MKERATSSFETNVKKALCHNSGVVCSFSASSEMWMPIASDRASATANTNMPTRIANLDWVPECSPAIRPKVVMTPEVIPKPTPFHS